MFRVIVSVIFCVTLWSSVAQGQNREPVWVQIEAQPSLTQAQERIRSYASSLTNVSGFALGGGWYGIVLGPYAADDARDLLRRYRRDGLIPGDSFIAYTSSFQQQFWPAAPTTPPVQAPSPATLQASAEAGEPASEAQQTPPAPAQEPPETIAQARASEARLTADERAALQTALAWAGHYTAAIDGAFGRGTRNAMAAWQAANGHTANGVLTTAQRTELTAQYNAVFNGLGLERLVDSGAGIALKAPRKVIEFSEYSPPFAKYESASDINARLLLISQDGTEDTLRGLYDIMQTLEIVPPTGPRSITETQFTLVGESATFISHTEVSLEAGQIKGFTLIWPAGDEERRSRLLAEMSGSFERLDGVLDPTEGVDDQSIDLVAGLEIRRPKLSRSGFFLDAAGHIVTTTEIVDACASLTIEQDLAVSVLANDSQTGIALLKTAVPLSPAKSAELTQRNPLLQSEVAVAGFSYEGVLGAPTLTFGRLDDVKGLQGEPFVKRLALAALPGDAGGPVFDETGAVLGMLLPPQPGPRQLPKEVRFAIGSESIRQLAQNAGLVTGQTEPTGRIAPEDLTTQAQDMTVLVSCWD
ncbi:serine protease [uncultured Lentibacter sp.]|uniref:serine protease n=1 Tax=uncultured Lentibacter sp. TaxID=1659309 RepID=UPI002604EB44|nr:serine protease [uncultured Lentibacter sp.]